MTATSIPTTTVEGLLAEHGQAIGSFAYLVLQHQADAERILGATLATALRREDLPNEPERLRIGLLQIAAREILRGSQQSGEVAPLLPDPGSSLDHLPVLAALAELEPRARMAVVLSYSTDLPAAAIASVLHDDSLALRSDLNEARNRLQAMVNEQPSAEPFDSRLRRALMEEAARFKPVVDSHALLLPPPQREGLSLVARRWWPLAIVALLAAGAGGISWLAPNGSPAGRESAAPRAPSAPLTRTAPGPISLADCKIAPADSPLAFAGWTTLAALNVHGGNAGLGQPIYALITRGLAEWVGWRQHDTGPMYPPPIGRMGCIFDPSTRMSSLVGVDTEWQPAQMADGCPPSAIDRFGGYLELGGPNAWLLLPGDTSAWGAGVDNRILFRLSSPAQPGQSVTAWAQPLGDAPPVVAAVETGSSQPGAADQSGTDLRYYRMDVRFATAGCWAINVAVNGRVVGSAIAPITAAPVAALPRRQGSR